MSQRFALLCSFQCAGARACAHGQDAMHASHRNIVHSTSTTLEPYTCSKSGGQQMLRKGQDGTNLSSHPRQIYSEARQDESLMPSLCPGLAKKLLRVRVWQRPTHTIVKQTRGKRKILRNRSQQVRRRTRETKENMPMYHARACTR